MRLSIESVDRRLEQAARTLGAGRWRAFRTVTLPLSLPGVIAGMVLGFARALGEFGATITFVSNVPGETQTLPLAIYAALQTPGGEALVLRLAGISVLLSLAALVASELIARRTGRGLHVL
jgi:molybdate transport system permease protein